MNITCCIAVIIKRSSQCSHTVMLLAGRVTVWDEKDRQLRENGNAHMAPITMLCWSPSGSRLISGDQVSYHHPCWLHSSCHQPPPLACAILVPLNTTHTGFHVQHGTICVWHGESRGRLALVVQYNKPGAGAISHCVFRTHAAAGYVICERLPRRALLSKALAIVLLTKRRFYPHYPTISWT